MISRGYLFQISWFSFAVFAIGEGVVISRRILQGWGVITTRWILPSGIVISRLILRVLEDYRSSHLLEEDYQGPCLLVEDYQGSCLLLEDYRGFYLLVGGLSSFLLVWLALQVLLLAAEHDLIDSSIGTAVDFVAGYLG